MRETSTYIFQLRHQLRIDFSDLAHVVAVTGMQDASLDLVTDFVTIVSQFWTLAQMPGSQGEHLIHDRSRALFLGQCQCITPALHGQFHGHLFGELHGDFITVDHTQHGHGRTQAQVTHAMTTLAGDFLPLIFQREAVQFDDVVQHPSEDRHDLTVAVPIETCFRCERVDDEVGQVD
ncbi:hypothetical protein D3C86_1462390 [compost metagenome]